MVQKLIRNLPLSTEFSSRDTYTKEEVNALIAAAVAEARAIDEASMAKHNRDATVISMILGFTVPFMDIDVNIIDDITRQVLEKLPKL